MARIDNLENFLGDVANAIRNKRGTTEQIPAENFDIEIDNIGSVVEKVVTEASEIIEEDTVVKIETAPIGEPVILPENGKAEVLANKTILAENIGVTPNKVVKGECILGINGKAETGVMTEQEYNTCEQLADNILGDVYTYDRLEYIITGEQTYIQLPYKNTHEMSYEITFQDINTPQWSVYLGDGANSVQLQKDSDTRYYVNHGGGANNGKMIAYDMTRKLTYRQEKADCYFNNEFKATIGANIEFTSNDGFTINCVGVNADGTVNNCCVMKLYNFKLWDDKTIYCDLIPVKRSDGEIGMLDNITKTFYASMGTGKFEEGGVE